MPANTPFPFWYVNGVDPTGLFIVSGRPVGGTLNPSGDGNGLGMYAQRGASAADENTGGYFYITSGGGGDTTGNYNYTRGGPVEIKSGFGGQSTGDYASSYGGAARFYSGDGRDTQGAYSDSYGGEIAIVAGNGGDALGAGSYSNGGNVSIYAGSSGNAAYSYGGSILLQAGIAYGGSPTPYSGQIRLYGGQLNHATVQAGRCLIQGGNNVGAGPGGDLILRPGTGGTEGILQLTRPRIGGQTVGSLPAASGANQGMRATVTDSNAVSVTAGIGAIVAGGGATVAPVFSDGTNWRIG